MKRNLLQRLADKLASSVRKVVVRTPHKSLTEAGFSWWCDVWPSLDETLKAIRDNYRLRADEQEEFYIAPGEIFDKPKGTFVAYIRHKHNRE